MAHGISKVLSFRRNNFVLSCEPTRAKIVAPISTGGLKLGDKGQAAAAKHPIALTLLVVFALLLPLATSAQTVSVNFGAVALGSNITSTVTLNDLPSTPAFFVLTYGSDFSKVSSPSCSGAPVSCSIQVQFGPKMAGWRQDGLLAESASGQILGFAFLNGIGQGGQAIFLPGTISTVAGTYNSGSGGYGPNQLNYPEAVAIDPQGKYVYLADSSNNLIRRMDAVTGAMTVYAGEYRTDGSGNPIGGYSGDGGQATTAQLNTPLTVALDAAGNLYISDFGNNVLRKVDPTGIITTFAGNYARGGTFYGNGGLATNAGLNGPSGVAVDSQGNVYVADQGNQVIREVTTDGIIRAFAGNNTPGYSGDGGAAVDAMLCYPAYVTVDSQSNIYLTDYNDVVRKVTTDGVIHTFAGVYIPVGAGCGGQGGYSGDGGLATSAELNFPSQVAVDVAGNLYIADSLNSVIRKVDTSGVISTAIGNYNMGGGYSGDGGVPTAAGLSFPNGVIVSPNGTSIFVADTGNSLIRKVSYAAPAMNFANTNVGSESTSQTTTIENAGNIPLDFAGLSVSTNFVQTASAGTNCSSSTNLEIDDTCQIAIAFEPATGGSLNGNVTISAGSFNIALTGIGNGPGVFLNPSNLPFGNQTINTSSTAQTVTLTNTGNQTLTISSISITGVNPGDFQQTNNCGSSIAASGNCTISVVFTPSATGSRSATLALGDSAAGSPQSVALTGTGVGIPQISFSPSSWSFGNQLISTTSTAESITVTNPGSASLVISEVTITGTNAGDFSQTNNCSTVAAGSGSCTIQVTFTPSATGSRTASISVTDNAGGSPHTVALSGTGTAPQISFSPNSWSFGNQVVNTTSTAESITVTNPGTATLTISSVSVTGTNSADFSQTNNCSTVAAGSGNCTIQVTFTPSATGSRTASISVTDNATGSPHTVALSGTGTAPQISFSPSSWSFGNQALHTTSSAESITVTNPGTSTLTISSVSINGTNAADFSQTNNCSTIAAGSGSCTIQVTFTPSAAGSRSASISVTDNAAGSPHAVSLSGTGLLDTASLSSATASVVYGTASTLLSANVTYLNGVPPTGAFTFTVDSGAAVIATCTGGSSPETCSASYNTSALSAGNHTITESLAADSNYGAASNTGTLTVTTATPVITFTIPNHAYGDAPFAVTATSNSSGAFTYSVISGPAMVSGSMVSLTGVGTVVLQASEAADPNFTAATKQTSFSVSQAALTVTANNATRYYGAPNPAFAGSITGAVQNDTFTESFATAAITNSPVGAYAIVPSASGADLGDYTVMTVNGTLTITAAPTNTSLMASSDSVNPNQSVTLTAAVAPSASGTPTGSITFTDNGSALKTVALANGGATYTTELAAGITHNIGVSYSGDANFLPSTASTSVSIVVSALTFSLADQGSPTLTVAPGSIATYGFTVTPNFGVYPGPVTFAVSGLPSGAVATFSPATLAPNSGTQKVTLSIQTTSTSAADGGTPLPRTTAPIAMALFLLPFGSIRKLRSKLNLRLLALVALACGIAGISACGTSGNTFPAAQPHSYNLTVTATSGTAHQTQAVTLMVE